MGAGSSQQAMLSRAPGHGVVAISSSCKISDRTVSDERLRQDLAFTSTSKKPRAKFLDVGLITGKSSGGAMSRKATEPASRRLERAKTISEYINTQKVSIEGSSFFSTDLPETALPQSDDPQATATVLNLLREADPIPTDEFLFSIEAAAELGKSLAQAASELSDDQLFVPSDTGLG